MTLSNLAYMGLPESAVEEVDLVHRLTKLLTRECNSSEELVVKVAPPPPAASIASHGSARGQ